MLLTPCPSEHAATIATCSSSSHPSLPPPLPCACDCTSHRLPLPLPLPLLQPHCLVPCILLREFFSLVSISRCFLLLFFLCLSRWKHVRKHLNQLCPKRHSQRGRAAASAIVMQNASTRPNQAANVLKLTQHNPSPLCLLLSSSHCQQFRATRKTK